MKIRRFFLLGLLLSLVPLSGFARQHTHIAMSTQKTHSFHFHLRPTHPPGPYGFGGKLSKSKDHKFHPVKQR